jgi:hypothetical protein
LEIAAAGQAPHRLFPLFPAATLPGLSTSQQHKASSPPFLYSLPESTARAMTAIAPASLRQLAPGNAASSSSNTTINPRRPYQSTPSIRPLKVLAPSTSTRHIVLAPPSIGREAPSPLVQSQRPIKIEDTHTTTHDNTSKETQQSSQRADSIESTDSSSASANRLHSGSTFTSPPFGGDDDVIQPRKEWVLPARAKPGRKPSDVEPPTVSSFLT